MIDISYFHTEIKLPNVGEEANTQLVNQNTYVNNIIYKYKRAFLITALGYSQAETLLSQFDEEGNWNETVDQKWKDLVDGYDSLEWKGLRYELDGKKYSMIADYVFCQYLFTQSQGDLTQLGVSKSEVEHSTLVSARSYYTMVWNRMCTAYQESEFFNPNGITLEKFLKDYEDLSANHFRKEVFRLTNRYGL